MKNALLVLLLIGAYTLSAQVSLNDYKYIIIPKKFDGFKSENQYLTSTYLKHLFSEKGFTAVYDDALPADLNTNRCLGLLVGLKDESSMFTTKTTLVLKDCSSREVFITQQGNSKNKEYKEAYQEAFTEAFISFQGVNYAYTPKNSSTPVTLNFKDDVKNIEEPALAATQTDKQAPSIVQEATPEQQSYKNTAPVVSDIKKAPVSPQSTSASPSPSKEVWYAQAMPYGYQLVDSTPKVQMQLYKSSHPEVFMAKRGDQSGLLLSHHGAWVFEYYDGVTLITEQVNVKF